MSRASFFCIKVYQHKYGYKCLSHTVVQRHENYDFFSWAWQKHIFVSSSLTCRIYWYSISRFQRSRVRAQVWMWWYLHYISETPTDSADVSLSFLHQPQCELTACVRSSIQSSFRQKVVGIWAEKRQKKKKQSTDWTDKNVWINLSE